MRNQLIQIKRWHDKLFELVSGLQPPFSLCVRLYWGWQLAESGWGARHIITEATQFLSSLKPAMPAVMAVLISWLECVGGGFLALGLLSRPTALSLTSNMIMGYVTAEGEAPLSI